MKIKTIKKILKRTNTVKEITIKDITPNSVTRGMFLPITYIPEIYLLTFHKQGITIIDRNTGNPMIYFPYIMIVSIE